MPGDCQGYEYVPRIPGLDAVPSGLGEVEGR